MKRRLWPRLIGGCGNGDRAPQTQESHIVIPYLPQINLTDYSQVQTVHPFTRLTKFSSCEEHYVKGSIAFKDSSLLLEVLVSTRSSFKDVGPQIWEELVDAGIQRAGVDESEIREMAADLYDRMISPAVRELAEHSRRNAAAAGNCEPFGVVPHGMADEIRAITIEAMVIMARGVKVA